MSQDKYSTQLHVSAPAVVTDLNLEDLIKSRTKDFGAVINDKIQGLVVQAFGPKGKGLWGGNDEVKEYAISKFNVEYASVYDGDHSKSAKSRRENPEIYSSVKIYLDKYRTVSNGLIYTDETFLKDVKKLFNDLDFGADIDYTEQGMQGETYVSMSIIFPMDVVAPEAAAYVTVRRNEDYKLEQQEAREKATVKKAKAAKKLKR